MTKHILDREQAGDATRAKRFTEIERQEAPEGSNKASKALHQRPQTRSETRTEQFLRIERGRRA